MWRVTVWKLDSCVDGLEAFSCLGFICIYTCGDIRILLPAYANKGLDLWA